MKWRSIINEPDILFGDEPTGALNSKAASEIMEILIDINQAGTTILLATHDAKIAAQVERVLYMLDGSITSEHRLGKFNRIVICLVVSIGILIVQRDT